MRILGDNSDGFKNERDLQNSLNFKIFDSLNPNLRHFLEDIYTGYNLKGKRIHAIVTKNNVKPDFYITIDGIPGGFYVSVKKGSGNSIHQEKINNFIDYLKKIGASDQIIDDLLRYHYSDGSNNNTGDIRLGSREFAKNNSMIVERLNKYFSNKTIIEKLLDRFVFVGNVENAPKADYIYHGDVRNGVWASKKEILNYIANFTKESNCVMIGPLTYQCWNKNLKRKDNLENRRNIMQIKWGSLEDTLVEITSRRPDFKRTGTYEGDMSEKASVIAFNRNPESLMFRDYLSFLNRDPSNVLMIRVTTKQFSKLSNQKVNTRADAYAIEVLDKSIYDILEENEYYLDEEILSNCNQNYRFIEKSGVSIKKDDSSNYTLIKLTPNSFYELFGTYELGYGASVYCQRSTELALNMKLLIGWHTTIEDLQEYFGSKDITENSLTESLEFCQKMKNISTDRIKSIIDNSARLQSIIFNGKDIYEEPYIAYFFMQNNQLRVLGYVPYSVTTGSGRSHGDYSIVLKPKNKQLLV